MSIKSKAFAAGEEAAKIGALSSGNPYDPYAEKDSKNHQEWETWFDRGWIQQTRKMEAEAG